MKGKTFEYAKQLHTIIDYSIDEANEKCSIKTNLNTFSRKYESMDDFLKYWQPAEVKNEVAKILEPDSDSTLVPAHIERDNALADEMIDILRDNIRRVQTDPGYVKQAQTINNNVNSIINVVRTKMDFMKQVKRK